MRERKSVCGFFFLNCFTHLHKQRVFIISMTVWCMKIKCLCYALRIFLSADARFLELIRVVVTVLTPFFLFIAIESVL